MKVTRVVCALALSLTGAIGIAVPASAVTPTTAVTSAAAVTSTTALTRTHLVCTGKYPVDATHLLTARQLRALRALVAYINAHPALFGTTCTVTV